MKSIDINDLDKELYKDAIDIREVSEYKENHIEGIKNIPMNGLLLNPSLFLTKDKTYYLLCRSGNRSGIIAEKLTEMGYDVYNLSGGIIAYKK